MPDYRDYMVSADGYETSDRIEAESAEDAAHAYAEDRWHEYRFESVDVYQPDNATVAVVVTDRHGVGIAKETLKVWPAPVAKADNA